MQIRIKLQKYMRCTVIARAWNVINRCNFYVTDSKIYCNTEVHDILKYTINTRIKLIVSKYTKIHTRK